MDEREAKIISLQKALLITAMEKLSYQLKYERKEQILAAGLKVISEKLNGLTSEQNEFQNELDEISDRDEQSMQTILEQEERFFTESKQRKSQENEHLGDIYNQIAQIGETQARLIDRYKIELQEIAFEAKQLSAQQQDINLNNFQSLYEEEKDKLYELENKFNELKQQLSEVSSALDFQQKDVLLQKEKENKFEERLKESEQHIAEKDKELKLWRRGEDQKNVEMEEMKDKYEKRINKLERELEGLREIRKKEDKEMKKLYQEVTDLQLERDKLKDSLDQLEEKSKDGDTQIKYLKKSHKLMQIQAKEVEKNEEIKQQLEILKNQSEKYEQEIMQLREQSKQQQDNQQCTLNQIKQQCQLQVSQVQAEAFCYLEFKDKQIQQLKSQLDTCKPFQNINNCSNNHQINNASASDNISNHSTQEVKDLQNLLLILSKDLREKESQINILTTQQNLSPLLLHQQYNLQQTINGNQLRGGSILQEQTINNQILIPRANNINNKQINYSKTNMNSLNQTRRSSPNQKRTNSLNNIAQKYSLNSSQVNLYSNQQNPSFNSHPLCEQQSQQQQRQQQKQCNKNIKLLDKM